MMVGRSAEARILFKLHIVLANMSVVRLIGAFPSTLELPVS